jgi:hypothetical protein
MVRWPSVYSALGSRNFLNFQKFGKRYHWYFCWMDTYPKQTLELINITTETIVILSSPHPSAHTDFSHWLSHSCSHLTCTRLFIILWHTAKQSVHLNGANHGNSRHTDRKRNSPSLYVPRVLSYVGGRQGCRLSENGDASREGILRVWVCHNIVDRDGAATFSSQVRKGPAG